jgi:hypothetical protein
MRTANNLTGAAQAPLLTSMVAQPMRVQLPNPNQLHRRSLAALYAREKAAADFRRVSRRLLQA